MTTTRQGRIVLKPRADAISKSAKTNYPLWKLSKELNIDEIKMLIAKRRRDLKYCSKEDINELRSDILILEDAYHLKIMEQSELYKNEDLFSPELIIDYHEVSLIAIDILNKMGFTQNTLFKKECHYLVERLGDLFVLPEEILATCVAKEILFHYNVSHTDDEILNIYQISDIEFYSFFLHFSVWCKENYWIS